MGMAAHVTAEVYKLLQFACIGLVNNEEKSVPQQTQRGGKPIKSIRFVAMLLARSLLLVDSLVLGSLCTQTDNDSWARAAACEAT